MPKAEVVRIVPVIPTTSIVQLWEKIQDKLDISELHLKVGKQSAGSRLELCPYMTLTRRPSSEMLSVQFVKRLHGVETLGNLCYRIEREGFVDAFVNRIVFCDNRSEYTFVNVPAPHGMAGYVKAIREKFMKQHGITPMPQLMRLRVLRLMSAKPRKWWTQDEKKALEILHKATQVGFGEDTLTTLKREYGALFCKVVETEQLGKVTRIEVLASEIEKTVWW